MRVRWALGIDSEFSTDRIGFWSRPGRDLCGARVRRYTSRFTGGKNAFEYLLIAFGNTQKNGHPHHPQTQDQLDRFQTIYNDHRPHRALDRHTPRETYDATITATPATAPLSAHYRVRIDTVDRHGKITLRHAGILHHLGIGRRYSGTPALILIDEYEATVTHRTTGEVLGAYLINPTTNYWPKQKEEPDHRPGSS